MRIVSALAALIPLVAAVGLTTPASAQAVTSGSFSVLSYNIAGLPFGLGDGDPETNTPIIGSRLGSYDIVHVQEDFNYHAALYEADSHPHRTATSGGVLFGDGLNTLSNHPFEDLRRVTWDDCSSGSGDCLTPKGFSFMRVRLAEGVWVDLYNLHTDAGVEPGDLAARRANLAQVSAFIQANSAGNAVIVYGDTNTRYTRTGDAIAEFASANGLSDPWVDLVRGGDAPDPGEPAITCDDAGVDETCEVVDKVLYRGSDHIGLDAVEYRNDHAAFRDDAGENLSDHYPVAVEFDWSLGPDYQMSDQFGGPHGDLFTDIDGLGAEARPTELRLRAGSRVDQIGLTLADGTRLAHGGNGGTLRTLSLAPGEYPVSLHLCRAKHDGHTRIFSARFTTSTGRTLAGGSETGDCTTLTAPSGWQIAGFHGRSGDELDKVGVIYTRR
ncbi:jacalin-like lectin [Myceligenerans pegani]|uniref:Endonuclease n=1 Tax=Myceligenerans pegani TaxID=2776917 RepID=A0ABR9N2J2_9MICO|nr:jacalin-like lectin [Myceligenerans sp. TRM 65318]MBE1877446.1 endonuclease [Myceligenerans sp. TRM 65318]MBE3019717.1 endonuclease [Myceligenerans sp. TRM 65318]